MDMMSVPGLLNEGERELLRDTAILVEGEFDKPTIVNIGIYMGASCYCLRVGAPHCQLYGVDINGWDKLGDTPELRRVLDMTLLQGDSREIEFDQPIHLIFVDGAHQQYIVEEDIKNWVLPHVVPGGYVLFHDAAWPKGSQFYRIAMGVSKAIELLGGEWTEQEPVKSIRWFRRV